MESLASVKGIHNPATIHVLIIEDNPGDARLLQEVLRAEEFYKFEFVHRENLKSGMEYLAEGKTDIVLLDLSLPDSQGFDTFQKVNAAFTDISIVVLTGVDDHEIAVQSMKEGAQDYLVKGEMSDSLLVRSLRYSYERMQAKKAMTKAYALKNIQQLAAAVCHEFSQPLQTLSGCLSLLEKEHDKKYIEISQKMIYKITELLAHLRDITDIKKQKYLSSQIVDLKASSENRNHDVKKRILVVDDEQSVLELLVQGLRMTGYDVDGAKDGFEALDMINTNNYHLIISDINMPRITGTSLFNMIRANNYPGLFIFLTGYSVSDDIESTIKKADGVLFKPINFQYLFDFVENLLTRNKASREQVSFDL
jgi:DNA-binding response OmpR family regulator